MVFVAPRSGERMDEVEESGPRGQYDFLVYCDDSGIHASTHYGFGSLWFPHQRRGDLHGLIRPIQERHGLQNEEIKWNKINVRTQAFYKELIDAFFSVPWLYFHCLLVRRQYVDMTFHNSADEARRKHFAMLIRNKVALFLGNNRERRFHIRVDKLPSSYEKADEAAHKIVNADLKRRIGCSAIETLLTRDSKTTLGIQVADILLGAVMSERDPYAGPADSKRAACKLAVRTHLATKLGWPDLKADTYKSEMKFNVWYFHNPRGPLAREVQSRAVKPG